MEVEAKHIYSTSSENSARLMQDVEIFGVYLPDVIKHMVANYMDPHQMYIYNKQSPDIFWSKHIEDVTNSEMVRYAAITGNVRVEDLIYLKFINRTGYSTLARLAIDNGNLHVLKHLNNYTNSYSCVCTSSERLREAIEKCYEPIIQWILQQNCWKDDLLSVTLVAAKFKRYDILKMIKTEITPITKDGFATNLYYGAIAGNHSKLIKLALKLGAKPDDTTLRYAALGGNINIVNNIISTTNNSNLTVACSHAIQGNHFELAKTIYELIPQSNGPNFDILLISAADNGNLPIFQWIWGLVEKHKYLDRISMGFVFMRLSINNHRSIIEWLGQSNKIQSYDGLLVGAIRSWNTEFVRYILTFPTTSTIWGKAVQQCLFGQLTILKLLVSSHPLYATTFNWKNMYETAIKIEENEIAEWVLQKYGRTHIQSICCETKNKHK